MGQQQSDSKRGTGDNQKPAKQWEPPVAPTIGKKKRHGAGGNTAITRIPKIYPNKPCMLKELRLERCKDLLLVEEEFLNTIAAQKRAVRGETEEIPAAGGKCKGDASDAGAAENDADKIATYEHVSSQYASEMARIESIRGPNMGVATLEEIIDDTHCIVADGNAQYYVPILSFVDKEKLELEGSVLIHSRHKYLIGLLEEDVDPLVSVMKVEKAPTESYADIGGLESQIQEIKEAVEYPLTHPELYEEIGIKPPKGVILYGVPGTGKTLLAKAVANQTSATFLRVVGSELIQKYSGEGPKLVRELFKVASDNAPSIVFIDEIDAIGTKRYDSDSSGVKEIQRTMLELLTQLDGFDGNNDVKVIMATNRIDTLDPALIRPGRIDRKIEFPYPDEKTKKMIFDIHSSKMSLADDVDFSEFINSKEEMSGADIKAICTEAGLLALRERCMRVKQEDFLKGKENVQFRKEKGNYARFYL